MQNHEEILSELGNRLGLKLEFDDKKQCFLLLDQKLMVSIRQRSTAWLFYGFIEDEIEWKEKSFWQNALALNLELAKNGGGSISYEPDSGAMIYVHELDARYLDAESAYEFLAKFVDRLEEIGRHSLFQA